MSERIITMGGQRVQLIGGPLHAQTRPDVVGCDRLCEATKTPEGAISVHHYARIGRTHQFVYLESEAVLPTPAPSGGSLPG